MSILLELARSLASILSFSRDEAQDETRDAAQDEAQDETQDETEDETRDETEGETRDDIQSAADSLEMSVSTIDPDGKHEHLVSTWLLADITGELTQVPFIGPKMELVLKEHAIFSTFQLIGVFLMLNSNTSLLTNWLKHIGVRSHLAGRIAHAIGAKALTLMPLAHA